MKERKTFIVEQAGQLYMRHGIRSVTMDDVASELGISKKTLYQLFKDKADLVEQVVAHYLMKDEDFHAENRANLNAIDRVLWMRTHILKLLKLFNNNLEYDLKKSYPKVYKKITEYKRMRVYKDNVSIIEQGQEEGLFRNEIDSDLLARLAVGRFLYIFNPEYEVFKEEETRDIQLFDKMMDYHFHGICTEKGIKYFKQQLNNVQNEN